MPDLVTIIMPVFNAEKFIEASIQSVLNQSYTNWELIVINDGSTDSGEALILRFTDTRIRYFKQTNQGVSCARNTGLREMKGEFFCFLDADDILPDTSIESRLSVFLKSSETMFVDGAVKVYDEAFSVLLKTWCPGFRGQPLGELIKLSERCFFGPTWMIRVSPGVSYRFDDDITHGEELLFYMRLARYGSYDFTSDCVLHYRKNKNSAMSNFNGLARGYSKIEKVLQNEFTHDLKYRQILSFRWRIRKIMFLSFASQSEIIKAFRFLLFGTTK